jgi:thioredoxin 1
MSTSPTPEDRLLVACLCAEWCGTCRDYHPLFDALATEFGAQARFVWVDIEDDDSILGNSLDVENFPTLLIARGDTIGFYGTVLPHAQTAARLIRNGLAGELAAVDDAALDGLAARVRALADGRDAS